MLDIDNFKHFNDQYGHLAGDTCLPALAQSLTQTGGRREGELVARYGGEEVAQPLQRDLRNWSLTHKGAVSGIVTISLSVASLLPSRGHAPDDSLREADAALYRAKQAGRDCVKGVKSVTNL